MSGIIAERGALHRNLGSCLFGGDRFRNRTSIGTATFTSHASIVSGPGRRSSPSKVMILENAGTSPGHLPGTSPGHAREHNGSVPPVPRTSAADGWRRLPNALPLSCGRPSAADRELQRLVSRRDPRWLPPQVGQVGSKSVIHGSGRLECDSHVRRQDHHVRAAREVGRILSANATRKVVLGPHLVRVAVLFSSRWHRFSVRALSQV